MHKYSDEIWGIIPARGGSKSIPLKNMAALHGLPLMAYVIEAAKVSKRLGRIICSTEDERIRSFCFQKEIEVHPRPTSLAADDTHILDVLIALLQDYHDDGNALPEAIALLQPTSPFVLPAHIDTSIDALVSNPDANSVQTISEFPHNYHAFNQRVIENERVRFNFEAERRIHYNKQTKPHFYVFGNLLVVRTSALMRLRETFPKPSIPVIIPAPYALDVDGPDDLVLAEWYLSSAKVKLAHMD